MTTGVIFIGSKFTADVNDKGWWSYLAPDLSTDYDDTGRKFVTSDNDARGKFADLLPESMTLVVDSDNNISLLFKSFRNLATRFAKTIFATIFGKTILVSSRKLLLKIYENCETFRQN
jgi:hypothetical protein